MQDLTPAELVRRQDDLQAEAADIEADLQLVSLLSRAGEPFRVGSAAYGLMVLRDLDVTVVCTKLALQPITDIGARLAEHPRVWRVEFRNDTGQWNTAARYPDGLYLGVGYRSPAGNAWKLDIWFVDEPARQPDLAHLSSIPSQLTPPTREAILRIKTTWASRPEYGKTVRSFDIYTAVLNDGVRTGDEFEEWLARRTQPGQ